MITKNDTIIYFRKLELKGLCSEVIEFINYFNI